MTQQTRRWNPEDAANVFVRVILSDAGTMLGGLTESEWRKTLEWFDGRCAYTGEELAKGRTEHDHAVPMNRTHCGLHLFGNVVPATEVANRHKAGTHYRHFLQDRDRLSRIDGFLHESGYWERVSAFGDLQRYCEAQYRVIDALCRVNREYLASLQPEEPEEDRESGERGATVPRSGSRSSDALPITLQPSPEAAFRRALLRQRHAWIIEECRDGRKEVRRWDARNMSPTSGVIGNLRSRPRYRRGAWEQLGIKSLTVTIQRP